MDEAYNFLDLPEAIDVESLASGRASMMQLASYLERFPFLQMINTEIDPEDDLSNTTFKTADSGWTIHLYGKQAMSSSPGQFLYTNVIDDEAEPKKTHCTLQLRKAILVPQTLYVWKGKPMELLIKSDRKDSDATLSIPDLNWQERLNGESEQTFSVRTKKLGHFPIYYQEELCGQLLVLEQPEPLPKRGTLQHQADVTAEAMVRMAKEMGWAGIDVVDGSMRMKLVSWVAAKALEMPIEGVSYKPNYEDTYALIQEKSASRLRALRRKK